MSGKFLLVQKIIFHPRRKQGIPYPISQKILADDCPVFAKGPCAQFLNEIRLVIMLILIGSYPSRLSKVTL